MFSRNPSGLGYGGEQQETLLLREYLFYAVARASQLELLRLCFRRGRR